MNSAVIETIRAWIDRQLARAREEQTRNLDPFEIPVGATLVRDGLEALAVREFLSAVMCGSAPDEAIEVANSWAREAASIHNLRRPTDIAWQMSLTFAEAKLLWAYLLVCQEMREESK